MIFADTQISDAGNAEGEQEEDEEFDWEIEQTLYEESREDHLCSSCGYGFGNQKSGVFRRLQVRAFVM